MKKASRPDQAFELQQIPNIGPAMTRDLRGLGIRVPADLKKIDPFALYEKLNRLTGRRHDPCVLDTFIAAVRFMQGKGNKPWFAYTEERKKRMAKETA